MSRDLPQLVPENCLMAKPQSSPKYRNAVMTRVYSARAKADRTQEDIAYLLGIDQTTYAKYETRSVLPMRYVRAFCLATNVSVEWLVTGEGKNGAPLLTRPPPIRRPGRRAKTRQP